MEPKTVEQTAANPLATAPIGSLLCRYSIPTTLTLLVNYLYNIADQIFVGQGVGITGMAATNVAFPLTIVTIALALLLDDGCAANLNLCPYVHDITFTPVIIKNHCQTCYATIHAS